MPNDVQAILDGVVEFWNTGNEELAKRVFAENIQRSDPNHPKVTTGLRAIADYVAQVHTGFPDFKLEIKEKVLESGRMITHWTCSGTHQGEFQGIPATGKRLGFDGVTWAQIENGKVVEEQVYFDRMLMLEQLGVASGEVNNRAQQAAS